MDNNTRNEITTIISNNIASNTESFEVRVYCPETPRAMLEFINPEGWEVIKVVDDETYQQALNASRAQEKTLYVFTFDYPAPREITSAAKSLDLKKFFNDVQLDDWFDYWEE